MNASGAMGESRGGIGPNGIDLTGKKFGLLTVREYVGGARRRWRCECECGAIREIMGSELRRGMAKSCGCHRRTQIVNDGRVYRCNGCARSNLPVGAFFVRQRKAGGGLRIAQPCRECISKAQATPVGRASRRQKQRNYSRRRRGIIDQLKAKPCSDCGRTFPPICMDFDHVRGAKRIEISRAASLPLDELMAEIAKCDLVCSNCHRIRTSMRRAAVAGDMGGALMSLAESKEFLESPSYPIVDLPLPFVDERGAIQNLTTSGAQSVAIISSKAGTSRASHVHKTDDHLAWVVSGAIEYWWQDVVVDEGQIAARMGETKHVIVWPGQAFYTPRHVAHTMHFLEDTVFVTLSCKSRKHDDHEADLIRVPSLKESAA